MIGSSQDKKNKLTRNYFDRSNLSAGQLQLLAVARCLLAGSSIVILDEGKNLTPDEAFSRSQFKANSSCRS